MASVPAVVGVLAGMLFLGERPGANEFIALVLVLASLGTVMFAPASKSPPAPIAPD